MDLKKIEILLIEAVKMSGINRRENMAFIGESLTKEEYKEVEWFICYLIKFNKTFGPANFKEVWQEFQDYSLKSK